MQAQDLHIQASTHLEVASPAHNQAVQPEIKVRKCHKESYKSLISTGKFQVEKRWTRI